MLYSRTGSESKMFKRRRSSIRRCIAVLFVAVATLRQTASGLAQPRTERRISVVEGARLNTVKDRRSALSTLVVAVGGGASLLSTNPTVAHGAATSEAACSRQDLLDAIARRDSDEKVIEVIGRLTDPSEGQVVRKYPERLEGQWELIWSYKAEAFSPLLKLPKPFRPDSYQYLGAAAASEVGPGRIAQALTGGALLGNNQLWLSSGAEPFSDDASVLEIQPPFRLQLGGRYGSGQSKRMLVDASSDAEFRQVNGRDKEAQAAIKNQYQQMYVEDRGAGSLRVSSVVAGDPVIVGEIFVHRKL